MLALVAIAASAIAVNFTPQNSVIVQVVTTFFDEPQEIRGMYIDGPITVCRTYNDLIDHLSDRDSYGCTTARVTGWTAGISRSIVRMQHTFDVHMWRIEEIILDVNAGSGTEITGFRALTLP